MCKKLNVFCLMLVITAVLSALAVADPISVDNPLRVDIDGENVVTGGYGFQSWPMPRSFSGPQVRTFDMGGIPIDWPTVEITPVDTLGGGGGSRNRSGGLVFVGGTGVIANGAGGFGRNYLQVKFSNMASDTEYTFLMWSFEERPVWAADPCNPDSKYGAWSTVNPNSWLVANGYSGLNGDPNGYGPINQPQPPDPLTAISDTNMPTAMKALAIDGDNGDRVFMMSDGTWVLGDVHHAKLSATSSSTGVVTLYGWIDPTDWSGSMHMPLNGFIVVPEPATVALLALGGLVLLRRKRT